VSLLPTIANKGIVFSSLLSGCLAVRPSVGRRLTCILCDATSLYLVEDFTETWHKVKVKVNVDLYSASS